MSILNFRRATAVSEFVGTPLQPVVLHVSGVNRSGLALLGASGVAAVYVAVYSHGPVYVGVTANFGNRAGLSPHLSAFGRIEDVFVITERQERLSQEMAKAGERIVYETLREVARIETIGNIPLGSPLGDLYPEARAFFGRALQLIQSSGLLLGAVAPARLLAGARGNADLRAPLLATPPDGCLYTFEAKGIAASVVETDDGWILLRDSQVCRQPVESAGPLLRTRIESMLYSGQLLQLNDQLLVTRGNLRFESASGAALFVGGSKGFGVSAWRPGGTMRNGKPSSPPRPLA